MRVLQINKYLHPRGGSETVCFQYARGLPQRGVEVDFWGMAHPSNVLGGPAHELAEYTDFATLGGLRKIAAGLATIYSNQARKSLESFLDKRPRYDIAHLHNFNYQLTPSILPALKQRGIKVVYTAHDSQLTCPFHRLFNFQENRPCVRCVKGSFTNCIAHRCVDGSLLRSGLAALESMVYHGLGFYDRHLDLVLAPSQFMAEVLSHRVRVPMAVLYNTVDIAPPQAGLAKEDFILYFGRVSEEKGILELSELFARRSLPLVIVGDGPDVGRLTLGDTVRYLGRKEGEELLDIVRAARFVIQPSKWYENCPMTVLESLACGTPVLAPDHSGFRELLAHGRTGFLMDFGSPALGDSIEAAFKGYTPQLSANCIDSFARRFSPDVHFATLISQYQGLLQ